MTRVIWIIAGDCENPYITEIWGRPSVRGQKWVIIGPRTLQTLCVELHTRCRKCGNCSSQRTRLWSARAREETRLSERTWKGTLTLRPEAYQHALSSCRAVEDRQGIDFDVLPEREQLALIHAHISRDITKMLKRIRAATGLAIRYLCVLELHQSGVPHYHMLVHEYDAAKPLRYTALCNQWPLGFSRWKLAQDEREAMYACKYLTKSLLARVRASQRYGAVKTSLGPRPPE